MDGLGRETMDGESVMSKITELEIDELYIEDAGSLRYQDEDEFVHRADFVLLIIRRAWHAGVGFEDLADGFGPGCGTKGDWSAIRDSSDQAINKMLKRALNHMRFEEST